MHDARFRFRRLEHVELLASGLSFPEGPIALEDGSVIVLELGKGLVRRVSDEGSTVVADLGGGPNGAAIGPDGAVYVCNNGGSREPRRPGIQRLDLDSGAVDTLYTHCDGQPLARPNDLVFDRSGDFWFTDYGRGSVFYAKADGSAAEEVITGLVTPNGIGLAPDEGTLYWTQTVTRQVLRRRLTAPGVARPSAGCSISSLVHTGEVDRSAVLIGLPGVAELDSMAVEEAGGVCVATLVDGGITAVAESGDVESWQLPPEFSDGAVTNICFGGPGMNTAYITLAMTGRLISCRWPRPGLRLLHQRGDAAGASPFN